MPKEKQLLKARGDKVISVEQEGSFQRTTDWLRRLAKIDPSSVLNSAGREGVEQLRAATPVDSGITASAWNYQIKKVNQGMELAFVNGSRGGGTFNIIQGLRYGHGTGRGGYVPPNDFVAPIFEALISGNIEKFVRSVVK